MARSTTDPISNLIVFGKLDFARHLGSFTEFDLPISELPTFIHESTHHWCFNSPVGTTLFLLFLRARRLALRQALGRGPSSDDARWDIIDALVRYEFADAMLRPLAEGLALFAEHDSRPGHSRLISPPLVQCAALFGKSFALKKAIQSGHTEASINDGIQLLLAGARLTQAHIRQKANLLTLPFSVSEGEGYLAGYLLVKQFWQANLLHHREFMFDDRDFHLIFTRSYFYDDWGLVGALLDERVKDFGTWSGLATAFEGRVADYIVEKRKDGIHKQFEQSQLKSQRRRFDAGTFATSMTFDPILGEFEAYERAATAFDRLFKELFAWPDDPVEQALVESDIILLAQRNLLNLLHIDADARVGATSLEVLTPTGSVGFSVKGTDGFEPGWRGRIAADIIMDTSSGGLYIVLAEGGVVKRCVNLRTDEAAPTYLRDTPSGFSMKSKLIDASWDLINSVGGEDLEFYLGMAKESGQRAAGQIYDRRALVFANDTQFENAVKSMATDGFSSVLGPGLTLDAAAASLCSSVGYKYAAVSPVHNWSSATPESSIETISRILAERMGMLGFYKVDNFFSYAFI